MLGQGIVDRHHRERQRTIGGHGAQPDNTGGGLLGAAQNAAEQFAAVPVEFAHQIGAIIHGELGPVIEGTVEMAVVLVVAGTVDREGGDPKMVNQRCRNVILGAQGVAGAERQLRPTCRQHPHQVGGLGGDVQTGADPHPL